MDAKTLEKFLETGYSHLSLDKKEDREILAQALANAIPSVSPHTKGTIIYLRQGIELATRALEALEDEAAKEK